MEQPTKRCSGQEKKKTAINGGGVGTVILLGGALVSAALTSAFLLRKRGWSSGENCRNTPSTAGNELKKTGLQHIASPHVQKHASTVGRKEVESDNDIAASTQVFKRDKKAVIEIKEAISEEVVLNKQEILPLGRKVLKVESKNMMHEVEIQFSKEDASTNNENYDFKQVYIEKKDFNSDNGKEEEEEALEESKVDFAVNGFELCKGNWGNHEALGCNDIEHETVNPEREVAVVRPLEIIREGEEAIEGGGREGETERVMEKLGEEDEECNQSNEEIVNVEEIPCGKEENRHFGDNDNSVHVLGLVPMPTEELIDVANEEIVCQQKIGQENDEADDEDDFSSEESALETGDSSVWPTELVQESSMESQQEKLIAQELRGEIKEHKTMKEGTLKINYSTNSTRWRWSILVGLLLLLLFGMSSIFCSWFLSLSFSEFCLFMFFIMLLSKICGFICSTREYCSCKRRLFEN